MCTQDTDTWRWQGLACLARSPCSGFLMRNEALGDARARLHALTVPKRQKQTDLLQGFCHKRAAVAQPAQGRERVHIHYLSAAGPAVPSALPPQPLLLSRPAATQVALTAISGLSGRSATEIPGEGRLMPVSGTSFHPLSLYRLPSVWKWGKEGSPLRALLLSPPLLHDEGDGVLCVALAEAQPALGLHKDTF